MNGGRSTKRVSRASPGGAPEHVRAAHGTAPGTLRVNGYSASWLKRGFPWVYPAEVVAGQVEAGAEVGLVGDDGARYGTGIADAGWIAVRRFRPDPGPIDQALFDARVAAAVELRRAIGPDTTAWRAVNAENDDLPGMRIDLWDRHAVLTLDSPSLDALIPLATRALRAALRSRHADFELGSMTVAYRRDPRDARPTPPSRTIEGTAPAGDVRVVERGVSFLVRPTAGKDTGLFTDMRENRAWLAAHWRGRRVLNLFAHTGAFSVVAALGGATEVVTVDLSDPALARARSNFAANGLDPAGFEFVGEDAFRALDRFRRAGRHFDLVVVDPPGYSHGEGGDWQGEKDWPRLAAACLRMLDPGGWLVAASNLGSQSPRQFGGALQSGAERVGARLRLVHEGSPPVDHPAALHFPEARYLKFWVMERR